MEDVEFWIQVIGVPIFTTILMLATFYWRGYLGKKAENAATKEDIKKITKKIERVKSSIDILKENQISFQTLRREAIVSFFEILMRWQNVVFSINFENVNLREKKKEFDNLILEVNNSESRLKLYLHDYTDYEKKINQVFVGIHDIQEHYLISLSRYNSVVTNLHLLKEITDEYEDWAGKKFLMLYPLIIGLTKDLRELIKNEKLGKTNS